MKFKLSIGALCVAFFFSTPALATVIYKFDFSNLYFEFYPGGPGPDFTISLPYDDYVHTTGMTEISGPAFPTTLGYSVAFAGTNPMGWWGFDNDGSAVINDTSFSFGAGSEFLSFLFEPSPYQSTYYGAPSVIIGSVSGNAPTAFRGSAKLTISLVPEPGTLPLVGLAMVGLAVTRRASLSNERRKYIHT